MSDALDRRDRLDEYSGERGSMVLVTERRQAIGALQCEVCNAKHAGGVARGVVLDEPRADVPWILWMLADGWSLAEHSDIRGMSGTPMRCAGENATVCRLTE